jgi:hypothetical protein
VARLAFVLFRSLPPCDKLGQASCESVHTLETTILVFGGGVIVFHNPRIDLGIASAKGCVTMFDLMVYAVLIFGFPLGILVGYRWRDRISQERRARYLAERGRA